MDPQQRQSSGYPPSAPPQQSQYGDSNPVGNFNQLSINTQQGNSAQLEIQHRPSQVVCGPLLRYNKIDYDNRMWHGSCLIVSNDTQAPTLRVVISDEKETVPSTVFDFRGTCIDSFRNQYQFWRFQLDIPLKEYPQVVTYTASCLDKLDVYSFHLAAIQESMRFVFHSCNGFSDIPQELKDKFGEKSAPLWQDVLERHETMPLHILVGGGDQLYQDRMLKEEFMIPWLEELDPKKRMAMRCQPPMRDGLEQFFFDNYVRCFGKESPVVARAFASIPSVNMWDDHDIIDGYGSYPHEMQHAEVFRGKLISNVLFANASRFYYLFQQHMTAEMAPQLGLIPGSKPACNSIVTTLGPDIALLALDCRGERTKYDICNPITYERVFNALYQLPYTVKHLVLVTGVPLIYPRLTLFEKAMEGAAGFNMATLVGKTGALGDLISGQLNKWNGDPELLDDMNDHWTAGCHEVERRKLILRLQRFARDRSIRVSFIAGDVHCCAAGKLYSKDMRQKEEGDPHLMFQIVSSAIVNVPPPQALLAILNQNSSPISFNGNTEEKMFNVFKRSPNGNKRQKNTKLMGVRNYCAVYYDAQTGKLNFWIQAEAKVGIKGTMGYLLDVPKLVFGQQGGLIHHLSTTAPVLPISPTASRSSVDQSMSGPPLPSRPSNPQTTSSSSGAGNSRNRPVPPPPMPPRPEDNFPSTPSYPPGPQDNAYASPGPGGFALPPRPSGGPSSSFGGGFVRPPGSDRQ
ncbi:hypothetical protein INT43_003438 [Umbelopsis isabellina]|uniref:PhoD-like phosphatase domain-containing protein n=1 Tax=Mortierella isabellina TaxID=91625 RepID=A0A8H7PR07_MORIS|nr:hypothetical protein INT43_003438 [Umbelopsis isabellina]